MSIIANGNLLPFRSYAEAEVVNLFALDGLAKAGTLVSLVPTSQDPDTAVGGYSAQSVGASYTNVYSNRYVGTRKVRASAVGDTKFNALGITLHTVAEYDENGNKLILQPIEKTFERGFVQSGWSVPVLTRGIVTLKTSVISGTPIPGYVAIPAANGGLQAVDPANIAAIGTGINAIGKFISTTGSAFGGYVQLKLEL